MKVNKVVIISIIINILLAGIIYNFINKDYLNNEKIIVKAMTETEYEDYITELNQSHENYANYIQASKAQIASAITDMGVTTTQEATPETMSSNIRSIARDAYSIAYDNTSSQLASTNVQGAVDELNNNISEINEWKTLYSDVGTETINLSAIEYKELYISAFWYYDRASVYYCTPIQILKEDTLFTENRLVFQNVDNPTSCGRITIEMINGNIKSMNLTGADGSNLSSSTTFIVRYR